MRLLPVLVLAALPGLAVAQSTLPEAQKAAHPAPAAQLFAADLGLPADAGTPKVGTMALSRAADATPSDFDTDKIAGNAETFAPLVARQKAAGVVAEGATEADFGLPADPDAPKTAALIAFHADGAPTIYDDDKIDGNEQTVTSGPLSDRQKLPSELIAGADPATFGLPAPDAAKAADLGVSKAEIAVPNVEDNDKIVGNPYVVPPLLPRQKAPAVLPDPVVDADMGQPPLDVPKVDLAVSKAADGRPSVNDNDKIDGNPVTAPPLAERTKAPAYEPALAGLGDADLGLPATPDVPKIAALAESKAQTAVATEYDDDKIAGNSYQPAANEDDYLTDSFENAPPPELIAQVRAQLDDPATRAAMLTSIASGGLVPEAVVTPYQSFIGALFDLPQTRDGMAEDIAQVFNDFGFTPDNPAAVGRVAAEYMAVFGEAEAWRGTVRRSPDEQRAYLTDALRIADTLPPEQCGPFLDGQMDPAQQRRVMLRAVDGWPEADRNAILINRAAAIIADLQDDPPFVPMPDPDAQKAREMIGTAALAAIDAAANGPSLLAAFGAPFDADPADHCAVQKMIVGAALSIPGPDVDLAVRYLVEYGWQN